MIKRTLFFVFFLASLCSIGQQNNDQTMKKTGENLLKYLGEGDTAAIVRLHFDYYFEDEDSPTEQEYKDGLIRILKDCKTYQMVTKKFGVPKQKDYTITDGFNGGRQLIITLSDKTDTVLNWSYCRIVIQFYPESMVRPIVFYNYNFDTGPMSEKLKARPIQTPPVIKNN